MHAQLNFSHLICFQLSPNISAKANDSLLLWFTASQFTHFDILHFSHLSSNNPRSITISMHTGAHSYWAFFTTLTTYLHLKITKKKDIQRTMHMPTIHMQSHGYDLSFNIAPASLIWRPHTRTYDTLSIYNRQTNVHDLFAYHLERFYRGWLFAWNSHAPRLWLLISEKRYLCSLDLALLGLRFL